MQIKKTTDTIFYRYQEKVVPEIKLTKAKGGKADQGFFRFDSPQSLLSKNLRFRGNLFN